ncbi:MAG: biopolymer transporter ExbD [Leptolyngbyaceae cyanobacterium SM1_1_3]|nr:biopolymer transporter ExbD [Leptolyngbyaceae cyanobacterium SM1_1_3]NJN02881.1 biopolymer transporter ExbD [Leptolyngbyaceae cyanobacterium RM1_1_2]NJO11829.1 biopolymer transporter ExbD [Leptolyngbyaceae cyanobacterium SL_1_1]
MGFSKKRPGSQIPEVNLIPMMDVLMTVLTFFIIISMTLTGQQVVNVDLPESITQGPEDAKLPAAESQPLVVGLSQNNQIILDDEAVNLTQLAQQVRAYGAENPDGQIILKADKTLPYSQVAKLLNDIRDMGANRVSLAVE